MTHLTVDGDGAQAVQEEQQGRVHVVKQVPGLVALRAQREADFGGPAEKKSTRQTINRKNWKSSYKSHFPGEINIILLNCNVSGATCFGNYELFFVLLCV